MNMKKRILSLLLGATVFIPISCNRPKPESTSGQAEEVSIIPQPMQLDKGQGQFEIKSETNIYVEKDNAEARRIAQILSDKFGKAASFPLEIADANGTEVPENGILLTTQGADAALGKEGYELSVKG